MSEPFLISKKIAALIVSNPTDKDGYLLDGDSKEHYIAPGTFCACDNNMLFNNFWVGKKLHCSLKEMKVEIIEISEE